MSFRSGRGKKVSRPLQVESVVDYLRVREVDSYQGSLSPCSLDTRRVAREP